MMNAEDNLESGSAQKFGFEQSHIEGSSHLLHWYLTRLETLVKKQGLTSLHWVTGVNTVEVGNRLFDALTSDGPRSTSVDGSVRKTDRHIIASPGDIGAIGPLAALANARVSRMANEYPDSFLVINKSACLDLTPIRGDGAPPEYTDDPTVVDLYLGLFTVIANAD